MFRFVAILMMFVLAMANGPAVAAAICQHQDGRAHFAALESADRSVSGEAQSEESAAKAVAADAALADAAGALLAGFILPADPAVPFAAAVALAAAPNHPQRLEGRSVPPLLEPPHA
jgi:hypothetical protein